MTSFDSIVTSTVGSERPAVCIVTMGCAKNEVDSAAMERRLVEAGFRIVDEAEKSDAVIVNTCSFIQSATEESLEAIFDLASLPRFSTDGARIIVAGCMPARYGDDLETELNEAAAFVPCSKEDDIVAVVDRCLGVRRDDAFETTTEEPRTSAQSSFAYVKISDGCDRWCSYCTIPLIRGRYHSFSFDTIFAEVKRCTDEGAREIVLIAQDTGRWGADFEEPSSLARLMGDLAESFPRTWFRVLYLQPEGVTDELLEIMRSHDNICNYLDIPLQHVDPDILKAMNRSGSREEFEELITRVTTLIPDITLRTTLIAGFPGESDEAFEGLCDFVESGYFDYVGVFPYSREEGTRAYKLDDQIDDEEKNDRAQRVRDIADAVSSTRIARRVGTSCTVLVEGAEEDGQLFGRAMSQAPEVDGVTYVSAGTPGEFVEVNIVDTLFYEMEGE